MKKKMMTVVLAGVMTLSTMACGANTETAKEDNPSTVQSTETVEEANTSTTQETGTETEEKSDSNSTDDTPKGEDLKIEDIDWSMEETILDGERVIAFNYTNNTQYTIASIEIKFTQKEGTTAEQLKVFDEMKEKHDWSDEDISDMYLTGGSSRVVDPGETVSDPSCFTKQGYYIESMEQYELMEPDMASIAYIGNDDKAYAKYYDFKTQKYSDSSEGGIDIHEWSDSEISNLLPKCEARIVKVSTDEEDYLCIYAYGVSKDEFNAYAEACKEKGFVDEEYDTLYTADCNEYELQIYYNKRDEEMSITIEKEDVEEESESE